MSGGYNYGLTPALEIKRAVYRKGKDAGRRAKTYDNESAQKALLRFVARYPALDTLSVRLAWVEGWEDAEVIRR